MVVVAVLMLLAIFLTLIVVFLAVILVFRRLVVLPVIAAVPVVGNVMVDADMGMGRAATRHKGEHDNRQGNEADPPEEAM